MNLTLTGILIHVLVTLAIGIGVSCRRTESDELLTEQPRTAASTSE